MISPTSSDFAGIRVAVTGGSGFIGSFLCEYLMSQGAVVRAIGRTSLPRYSPPYPKGLEYFQADLTNSGDAIKSLRDCKMVFHLAAKVAGIAFNIYHPASMFTDNVAMALNVLEACRRMDVERILLMSSTCVYPRNAPVPTPESWGFSDDPEPTNIGYGWAKRVAEKAAQFYANEYGLKIAIVRPENVYGPRDNFDPTTSHVIPALIRRIYEANEKVVIWGSGNQTRSFIYVTDLVEALCLAIKKYAVADPLNIGCSEEVSIGEIAKMIIALMGKNHLRLVFDSSKPEGMPHKAADVTKMRKVLGFKPKVSLEEGLKGTIEWFLSNYSLARRTP